MKGKSLFLASCLFAAAAGFPVAAQQVSFEAEPGTLRVVLQPEGASRSEGIVLSFEGSLYQEGATLVGGTRSPVPLSEEAAFVASYLRTWKQGTYDDLLPFWAPDQKDEFQKYFPRSSFELQRKPFVNMDRSLLLADLSYGSYQILVAEIFGLSKPAAEVYAVERIEGKLFLTYELLTDPVFHLWRVSLADRAAQRFGR